MKIKKILLYFALPVIVIIASFRFSKIAGIIAILAYILAIVYLMIPYFYKLKGSKSYNEDNIKDAINWFEKAYKTGRSGTGTAVSLAYLMLKNGDVQGSEELFNKIHKASDTSEDYKKIIDSNIALIEWKKGNIDKAIEIMENLIPQFKTSNIYGSLGYLYIVKGDMEKALEFNLEAFDYNNTNSIILDNLGETYYWLERYEDAEDIYKKLMDNNPTFPEAYYHYCLVLEKLGRRDEALDMIRRASKYKTNFLSSITKEQINNKLKELETNTNLA